MLDEYSFETLRSIGYCLEPIVNREVRSRSEETLRNLISNILLELTPEAKAALDSKLEEIGVILNVTEKNDFAFEVAVALNPTFGGDVRKGALILNPTEYAKRYVMLGYISCKEMTTKLKQGYSFVSNSRYTNLSFDEIRKIEKDYNNITT